MYPPLGTLERGTYYEWFVLNGATLEPLGTAGFHNPDDLEKLAGLQSRLQMPFAMGESFTAVDVMLDWQLNVISQAGVLDVMPKAAAYHQGLADWLD